MAVSFVGKLIKKGERVVYLEGVKIEDTFAEAFPMRATRIIITAFNSEWAKHAGTSMTGFATSVIACGCEAAIECELLPDETPDGRPGVSVLLFAASSSDLKKQLETRVGQCVLTCPTTSVFCGLEEGSVIPLTKNLRFFGDGWQISKFIDNKRYWRVPTMDGEFLGEETSRYITAVGGGNIIVLAEDIESALQITKRGVYEINKQRNVITPFPGGIVRSGSKVGSKYKSLIASTNEVFCPAIFSRKNKTKLFDRVKAVLEIVIDGLTEQDVAMAMEVAMRNMISEGSGNGLISLSAGNYGGKLGPYHFHLHKLLKL